jgi:hypothetical protein
MIFSHQLFYKTIRIYTILYKTIRLSTAINCTLKDKCKQEEKVNLNDLVCEAFLYCHHSKSDSLQAPFNHPDYF